MKEVFEEWVLKGLAFLAACVGRRWWLKRRQRKKEEAEMAEIAQWQKEAEAERQKRRACEAARDCQNFLPIVTGRTHPSEMSPTERAHARAAGDSTRVVKKFKPRKGKSKHGRTKKTGTKSIE